MTPLFLVGIFFSVCGYGSAQVPLNTNTDVRTEDGQICYFPFRWNAMEHNSCQELPGSPTTLWCSLTYNYDAEGQYGFCDSDTSCAGVAGPPTSGGTANRAACCFPFTYQGQSHSECITTPDRPFAWCSVKDEHRPGDLWGYCEGTDQVPNNTNTDVRTADGTLCYFPFLHQNQLYSDCVVGQDTSRSDPWCATSYFYDSDLAWGYCDLPDSDCSGTAGPLTLGGTAGGARCCFPFPHEGSERYGCVSSPDRPDGTWCVTTGELWGYCDEPDTSLDCNGESGSGTSGGTAEGAPCCFPFIYSGQSRSACVRSTEPGRDPDTPWCGTTDNYDIHAKWGYCNASDTTTKRPSSATRAHHSWGVFLLLITIVFGV